MFDLALYHPDGAESLGESGRFGAVASGPIRAAARVGYELLLRPGTVAGRVAGTRLLDAVLGASTSLDLVGAFLSAATDVMNQLAANSYPDDETVVAIYLIRILVTEGTVVFMIAVETVGGATANTRLSVSVPSEAAT